MSSTARASREDPYASAWLRQTQAAQRSTAAPAVSRSSGGTFRAQPARRFQPASIASAEGGATHTR